VSKIFQLAKLHTRICHNLQVMYIDNLQDVRNVIVDDGQMLMRGFTDMILAPGSLIPLLHSVRNTSRPYTKAILFPREHYQEVINQMGAVHPGLLAKVQPPYFDKVLVRNLEATLTSGQQDTVDTCNSTKNASELFNFITRRMARLDWFARRYD
jgi:hypothetical protein